MHGASEAAQRNAGRNHSILQPSPHQLFIISRSMYKYHPLSTITEPRPRFAFLFLFTVVVLMDGCRGRRNHAYRLSCSPRLDFDQTLGSPWTNGSKAGLTMVALCLFCRWIHLSRIAYSVCYFHPKRHYSAAFNGELQNIPTIIVRWRNNNTLYCGRKSTDNHDDDGITDCWDLLITNAWIGSSGKWDNNRIIIICTFTWRVAEISESTSRAMPFLYPTQPYPWNGTPLKKTERKKERCKRQPGHMMTMKKTMTSNNSQVPCLARRESSPFRGKERCVPP